ncbi:MAG TPA: tetratricopeptide repeat protein, partial [Phycisphaerales bacterium]|nr:tetratricopeptide repeat protein [Phycisphaerales bacterium]
VVAITLLAATGVSVAFGVEATYQRRQSERHLRDVSSVASFQARMLSDLDPAVMAGAIADSLTADVARALEHGAGDVPAGASVGVFSEYLHLANPTNAALAVLHEHLLQPAERAAEREFGDRPVVLATLLGTIADSYLTLGLPHHAERPRTRSLDLFRATLGEAAEPTLDALNNEAVMFAQLGRPDEAERRLLRVRAARQAVLSGDHPDTIRPLIGLADAAFNLGRLDDADARYRQALEGFRSALGPDAPETLAAMNSLGNFLGQIGQMEESERLLRSAYEARLRTLGREHPDTLDAASSLGTLLHVTGRYAESEAFLRESLAIRRRLHGDNHPSTITSINNLATLLSEFPDRADESYALLRQALDANLRLHGPMHQDSLLAMSNLGTFHAYRRENDQAEPLMRQVWLGSDAVLGPEHPDSIISRGMYSSVLRTIGRHDEAREHLHAALNLAERHLPSDHLYVPVLMVMLGKTHLAARDPAAAVPVLLEAAVALEGLLGPAAPSFLDAAAALADAYDMLDAVEPDAGHAAEAARWRARLGG